MAVISRKVPARGGVSAMRILLYVATFGYVWLYTVGLNPLTDRSKQAFEQYASVGSQQYILFYAALGVFGLIGIFVFHVRLFRLFDPSLVALIVWMAITLSVSVTLETAVLDYGKTLVFMLGTATLVMSFRDEQDLVRAFKIALLLVIAADLVSIALFPTLTIHQANDAVEGNISGAWRGLHEHKGKFGEVLIGAAILCLYDRKGRWDLFNTIVPVICLGVCFMAMAKTSIVGAILGIIVAWTLTKIASYSRGPIATIALITPVAALALSAMLIIPVVLNEVFGDITFTGRTKTWGYLLAYSADHPWFGSGYSSFFIGERGPLFLSGDEFLKHIGHAHNTYLDMLVTLGWPGVILSVLAFLVIPVAQNYSRLRWSQGARLWIAMLMFLHVSGITVIVYFANLRPVGMFLLVAYFALRRFHLNPRLSIPAATARARATDRQVRDGARGQGNVVASRLTKGVSGDL